MKAGSGTVHNKSDIAELYNEYGAKNQINNNATRSSADVLIGIKTGKEITYIIITIFIIAFLVISGYFMNKRIRKMMEEDEEELLEEVDGV